MMCIKVGLEKLSQTSQNEGLCGKASVPGSASVISMGLKAVEPFHAIPDLLTAITVPEDGTLSKTIYSDDFTKVVLFGFAPGQELSQHTAAVPAIMHFLSGKARVTIGENSSEAVAGSWYHMMPNVPHSLNAIEPTVMLLILNKAAGL